MLLDQLSCTPDDDIECIMSISTKYADLLKASENHIPIDLYRLKANSEDMNFVWKEQLIYYARLIWRCIWRTALIFVPVIAVAFYFALR